MNHELEAVNLTVAILETFTAGQRKAALPLITQAKEAAVQAQEFETAVRMRDLEWFIVRTDRITHSKS